ncbi:MAG TPA: PfkB family carbohydrate kinase [Candidatus Dormibacteraeota bacterium]
MAVPPPRLLVAGSIALDSLQGGRITDELGGSALYFSLAASLSTDVQVVAPVGRDAEARVRALLGGRPRLRLDGLAVVDAPTYRWFAEAHAGRNVDLGSRDSIYDRWTPAIPPGYRGWAFVGSMRPDRQLDAARQLAGCGLLAADAMRSYVESAPETARSVLRLVDWYFCNQEEFAALGGVDPDTFRRTWGLDGLVVKHGPGGASVWTAAGRVHVPAGTGPVVDTTGAGDALAGGMLAHWLPLGGEPAALLEALRAGVDRASVAISEVGARALAARNVGR